MANTVNLRSTETLLAVLDSKQTTRALRKLNQSTEETVIEEDIGNLLKERHGKKRPAQPSQAPKLAKKVRKSTNTNAPDAPTKTSGNETSLMPKSCEESFEEASTLIQTYRGEAAEIWNEYKEKIAKMQASRLPIMAQTGRHLEKLSCWFLADPIYLDLATVEIPLGEKTPSGPLRISTDVMKWLGRSPRLGKFAQSLKRQSEVDIVESSSSVFCRAPLLTSLPDDLVASIASALYTDTAAASAGDQVEADTKLVTVRLLADVVAFLGDNNGFALEMCHRIGSTSSIAGTGKSDFAITMPILNKKRPLLIVEYAASEEQTPVHKDFFTATAEAVYESHRLALHLTTATVHYAKVFIAWGSGRHLHFAVVYPIIRPGGVFWILDKSGPTFDFSRTEPEGRRFHAALMMGRFFDEHVFPTGVELAAQLRNEKNLEVAELLPLLPVALPAVRPAGLFTPQK